MGMIKTKDGRYVKILEVDPQNFSLKKSKEQNRIIDRFYQWLNICPISMQFKIITEKTDISTLIEDLEDRNKNDRNEALLEAQEDYINLVKKMSNNEASAKRFFLIIEYEGNPFTKSMSADEITISMDMEQSVNTISQHFFEMGNSIIYHENENEFLEEVFYRYICKRSAQQETIRKRKQRIIRDMRIIRTVNSMETTDIIKASIKSVLSPKGVDLKPMTYTVVDGVCYTHLFIMADSYPTKVYANWTGCFDFGEGVDVDMFFIKKDAERVTKDLGPYLAKSTVGLKSKRDNEKKDLEDSIVSGLYINERLRQNEDFFYGVIMLTIWDYNLKSLKNRKGEVMSRLSSGGIKTRGPIGNCEKAFNMSLPLLMVDKQLFTKFQRNFLTSSLSATYPFNEMRLRDRDAFVIGLTGNSLALFNNFYTRRYTNANIGIFGPSGSGKTYTNLFLSRRLRLNGVNIIYILPIKGHEYKDAVAKLGGMFIDLSPGSNVCLNIMAIHAEAQIDEAILAETEVTVRSKLQQQITQVITWVQLLLKKTQLSSVEESELETVITDLYARFGISNDNLSLYDENGNIKVMPIIEDLYNDCMQNPNLANVVSVLTPFVNGNCKNMNGQTNIDLNNGVIAFDVSYAGDRYMAAFMFIALVFSYSKIKENVYDLYALFLDELWKMLENEMAEAFVNELIKIIRGYGGGAVVSTQNLSDILKSKYGESIIDNCASKILIKAGEKESEIFQRLFHLSEEETRKLEKQKKGMITLLANGEKIPIITKTSFEEHITYTTDPVEKKKLMQAKMKNLK